VVKAFAFPYLFYTNSHLEVHKDGVLQTTGYTVTGAGVASGGTVTFTFAPASGVSVVILRAVPLTQLSSYPVAGAFPAKTVEKDQDLAIMAGQQHDEELGRAIKLPKGTLLTDVDLPTPTGAAKYPRWNTGNTALELAEIPGVVPALVAGDVKNVEDYASFIAAVDAIGGTTTTLIVPSSKAVTANRTVPATLTLWFIGSGQLSISGGVTVTINGRVESPSRQIFSGSGTAAGLSWVDARWYGASPTASAASNTTALKAAITNADVIYIPNGTYSYDTTLVVTNGKRIYSDDWLTTSLSYTGLGSGIRNTNGPNSSGYGRVTIDHLTITSTGGVSNTGAGIEFQSGGFSYYQVHHVQVTGQFKYGIIFDASEVSNLTDSIIENGAGISNSANLWLTNGDEWTATQSTGYTNVITVARNQLNNGTYAVVDDGGDSHFFIDNNYNGNSVAIRAAGGTNIIIDGGDIENAGIQTGIANILFTDTALVGGASKGTWKGGSVRNVTFSAAMVAGSSTCLKFASAADFHESFVVEANRFDNQLGRSAAIDVTQLRWSRVGPNYEATSSLAHFTGIHNNANGNFLHAPPNASDTKRHIFGLTDTPISTYDNYELEGQRLQSFVIEIINTAGTLQHAIINSTTNATASGYVDKVTGASSTLANTPTVNAGVGFTSGAGINANTIVFDTIGQTNATLFTLATVEYYDGNVVHPRTYVGFNSRNVNGSTLNRLEISIINAMTGAAWTINTTNLPAGKAIWIRVLAWLA
jgi:hypothetical protein